jgi:hypothetical protein
VGLTIRPPRKPTAENIRKTRNKIGTQTHDEEAPVPNPNTPALTAQTRNNIANRNMMTHVPSRGVTFVPGTSKIHSSAEAQAPAFFRSAAFVTTTGVWNRSVTPAFTSWAPPQEPQIYLGWPLGAGLGSGFDSAFGAGLGTGFGSGFGSALGAGLG